jgi:hypothetical protein
MTMLSFRTDSEEADQIRHWSEQLGVVRSELLRRAVHRYLVFLRSQADALAWKHTPLTDAEASLGAVADWGPAEDWSDWADAAG